MSGFGAVAAWNTRYRTALLFASVVLLDAATKTCAYLLLPAGEPVREEAIFQIVLRLNPTGLGSWPRSSTADARAQGTAFALTVLTGLAVLLVVRRFTWRASRKALAVLSAALLMSWIAPSVADFVSSFVPALAEPRANVFLLRASQAAMWTTLWLIMPERYRVWQYCLALLAAAAVGNFGSLLLPPFQVVDFVYSSLVHELVGFGVFNLADIAYLAAFALLLGAAGSWLVRRAVLTTRR